MKRRWIVPALLLAAWLTTGCAAVIAGAGAGAGVYSYLKGELRRAYPAEAQKTLSICVVVLDRLQIRITEQTTDGETVHLHGKRPDGTPVRLRVLPLNAGVTEVGVRSGVIGYWDRRVSELIHAEIAQRL